jgi:hypothetical protein
VAREQFNATHPLSLAAAFLWAMTMTVQLKHVTLWPGHRFEGEVMSRHFAIGLAWPILALSVVLTALGLILFALTAATPVVLGWGFRGQAIVYPLIFTPIGALLAVRRHANPIGWIFCVVALAGGFMVFAQEYAVYSVIAYPGSLPLAEILAWILNWIWIPAFIFGITFLLLLFPDGRLLSPRWRFVVWLAIFTTALPTVARILTWPTGELYCDHQSAGHRRYG